MIVHHPVIRKVNDKVCLASRFEFNSSLPAMPPELWYCFPEIYERGIDARSDAFAATGLLLAMYTGENLMIRGPISPKLAYGLLEFGKVFHMWWPKLFHPVDIEFQELSEVSNIVGKPLVASAFSGGVDSFYTLKAHLKENQVIPSARITHGVFIQGIDLRLEDEENYQSTFKHYQGVFRDIGLELIPASTNAYQFSQFRIDWTIFWGPPLIGAALTLSSSFGRFYVPSFMSYNELVPHGGSPVTDHLLSTETMEIIHHGASSTRFDKLADITNWPVTYHQLRVCSDKDRLHGIQNCGKCHKCYRTMASLEIIDAMPNYDNFDSKLTFGSYFRWGLLTLLNPDQAGEIGRRALGSGRVGMAMMIELAILLSMLRRFAVKLVKRMLTQEQLYRIKQALYPAESSKSIDGV